MRKLLVGLMVATGLCSAAHAEDTPKFKNYPADIYSGPETPIRLDAPEARQYRTRLQKASRDPINFGGRYVFTQWGAGTQCDTGALIDVKTGQVHVLPFAACFWQSYDRPFEFRKDSRLLVVAGQVGETGPTGAHFFEFTGKEFKRVGRNGNLLTTSFDEKTTGATEASAGPIEVVDGVDVCKKPTNGISLSRYLWGSRVPVQPDVGSIDAPDLYEWQKLQSHKDVKVECSYGPKGDQAITFDVPADIERCTFVDKRFICFGNDNPFSPALASIEPAAGNVSPAELIARIEANPKMGPLWKCYGQGLDMIAGEVARNSTDEKEYIAKLTLLGGFMKLGNLAVATCNQELIGDLNGRSMPDYAEKANQFWASMLLAKDEELFAKCKSKTDADWAGIRAICERQENIFRARLNSL